MPSSKITPELREAICKDIADGLSNKDACYVNDIDESTFYKWLATAKESKGKPASKLSVHQRACRQVIPVIKKREYSSARKTESRLYNSKQPL